MLVFGQCLLHHSRSRTSSVFGKAQECGAHEGIQPGAGPMRIIFGHESLSTVMSQLRLRQSLPFLG